MIDLDRFSEQFRAAVEAGPRDVSLVLLCGQCGTRLEQVEDEPLMRCPTHEEVVVKIETQEVD